MCRQLSKKIFCQVLPLAGLVYVHIIRLGVVEFCLVQYPAPCVLQVSFSASFPTAVQIDVCEDLVLLSTCIDACTRLGDLRRLRELLAKFDASNLRPSAHAYGTLIKAYGRLGNIQKVRRRRQHCLYFSGETE